MKIGVADFGMSVWDGGCFDAEERWIRVKEIGYDGIERLVASSAGEALRGAARMRRRGVDFATCLAPNPDQSIEWTAALGKNYVWTAVTGRDFETFCRQVNIQAEACARWGIRLVLHNHLGTLVESQQELETFLARCPRCCLLLDTAHLAAAGGDPIEIARKYAARIEAVHLKDWIATNPEVSLKEWTRRGRFCELGAGNIGLDNVEVLRTLVAAGFDGWVLVEQDTHLQDPLKDLAISREYLRKAGF